MIEATGSKLPPALLRTDYGHRKRPDLPCRHMAYGLTCEQYEAMRDRAGDRCEICETPDRETPRGELVIDHFTDPGRVFFVRGLLCDRCNSVMQRHDRTAPWGPRSRPWAEKARAYHLAAFAQPSADVLARADAVIQARRPALEARLWPSANDLSA